MKNIRERFFQNNGVKFLRENGEQGSTLVIVLIMMATMLAIAVGAINLTQLNVASSGAHKKGKQAFYAAEAGLDWAVNDIVNEFEDFTIYTTTADQGGTPGMTFANYQDHEIYYNTTNPLDRYLYRTIIGNGTIFHYAYTYNIESTATSLVDNSKETLRETIRILETPLVQYFAFYAGTGDLADLELYPGATMNIWGRMHANRHMYMTSRSATRNIIVRNFDLNNQLSPHFLTMGGEFRGDQKHNTSTWSQTGVYVRTNNDAPAPVDVTDATQYLEVPLTVDSGNEATVESDFNDYLLVNERTYQAPDQTQFWRGAFYEGKTENPGNPRVDTMKIVGTGPVGVGGTRVYVSRPTFQEITNLIQNGNRVSDGVSVGGPPITEQTAAAGANPLYDRREGRWVDFTEIDLNYLGLWYDDYLTNQGLNWAGDGMLIYVSRSPLQAPPAAWANGGANLQAIRLRTTGGSVSKVHDDTTVATDNPIYIQGNFNTPNPVGVALVSDATNILSQAFVTKGVAGNPPAAATTTVNAAFFSGVNVNTENGGVGPTGERIGGGLHNYPRLHENWGNANTLNINGSFIALWMSAQAPGQWCHWAPLGCYFRPTRNYGWDVNFENPTYWPPFIPSIFSVERVGFLEG